MGDCMAEVFEFRPPVRNDKALTSVVNVVDAVAVERSVTLIAALIEHLERYDLPEHARNAMRGQTATGTDAELVELVKGCRQGVKHAISVLAQAGILLACPDLLPS